MAELADARDLKSREIFSRTGSTPASGTIYIAEWSSLAARRAHNPKVMRFKSHLRNQVKPKLIHRIGLGFLLFIRTYHSFKGRTNAVCTSFEDWGIIGMPLFVFRLDGGLCRENLVSTVPWNK